MAKKRVSLAEREKMQSPIKNTLMGFMSTDKSAEPEEKVEVDVEVIEEKKPQVNIDANLSSRASKVTEDGVTKSIETKKLKLGASTFKVVFDREEDLRRAAYHLHQDTIDKIELCSKSAGMKKAEFVDLILNAVLSEIVDKSK